MSCIPPHNFDSLVNDNQFADDAESPVIPPCFAEDVRSPGPPPHFAEDVVIPAHLLAGVTSSCRDTGSHLAWHPQRAATINGGPRGWNSRPRNGSGDHNASHIRPRFHRSSTLPSGVGRNRRPNLSITTGEPRVPGKTKQAANRVSLPGPPSSRRSWRLSFTPGSPDSITSISPQQRLSQQVKSKSYNSAVGSNPFEASLNEISRSSSLRTTTSDPFATREHSIISADGVIQNDFASRTQTVTDPDRVYAAAHNRPRRGTIEAIVDAIVPEPLQRKLTNVSYTGLNRVGSIHKVYEKAKTRGAELQRKKWAQVLFEYGIYVFILSFVYFVLIGLPLWKGAVWWLYWVVANKFVFAGGFGITLGIALFYAFVPLFVLFEKAPPENDYTSETKTQPNVQDTALLIPCYKSANLIAATLEAALKVFPPSHIYVIANGNSLTPLDNTEEVCEPYGVNHIWSPIGSKIVAQFVGCYAAKEFKNVLLIDDDCALPDNFPVVTDRLKGRVMCVGYTIKSVGPNSSKGNLCQQAQDLEYKLSGLQRKFAGHVGSATFPHGAISLWDRKLLVQTFHEHPGFNVSEDWFFGHVARELGCRITMCSSIFVETETPTAVFFSSGGSRGGFGEMTIFQQRFKRWNFFFVNGMYYNMKYIFCSWKLGWWEIGAKIFVFQEVYETLLYLLTPFVLPISFYVRPSFAGILLGSTILMYLINVIIFNEVHLRRKNERLGWVLLYVYYLPYKIILTGINVASCYWSLYKYARYFARRHPKVTEDEKAVEVVLRLEEDAASRQSSPRTLGRSLTVRTIDSNTSSDDAKEKGIDSSTPSPSPQQFRFPDPRHTHAQDQTRPNSGGYTPTHLGLMEGISTGDFAMTDTRKHDD
ncbi:nucleotide-diphospho-sugar transferase [Dendryphion nanum]|uniref:Nucleotide-diphospho-sugar transferase n=1 Tax=Dendryphion nanum TaxID=256645 RepID=A0A9P9ILX2_9PLEO|nr:nucleotide-diphospho-sugar transferase [Dendryphion nanum]